MLQLVTGRAGTGKTEFCLAEIERLAAAGKHTILIVPEQNSFAMERALALRLAGPMASFAEVRSFRALCKDVFSECGGGARKRASDAVRVSLVRRAVDELSDHIVCFRRQRKDITFFSLAAAAIAELENAGVTPSRLTQIAQTASSPLMVSRLSELAEIYKSYKQLLQQHYHDTADELLSACALVKQCRAFDGKTIIFDSFSGFTEPQYELIGQLLCAADAVVVTLLCDALSGNELDCFTANRECGRRLEALAQRCQIAQKPTLHLHEPHRFHAAGLVAAEAFLASQPEGGDTAGVYAIEGNDRYHELLQVADEMVSLVRNGVCSFGEIVVITHDFEGYRAAVERTLSAFDIPFFRDANRNLLYTPLLTLLLAAFDIVANLRTESILQLLKTGICDMDADTVAAVEDYCFVWEIDRGGWFTPFDQNPDGFGDANRRSEQAVQLVEAARRKILYWIQPLRDVENKDDAGAVLRAVYETAGLCGALRNREQAGGEAAREASMALEVLDSLFDMTVDDRMTPRELRDLATLQAASTPLGEIPPTLEQVAVGSADRMRADNPKVAFVLGLNDGVFPATAFDSPLLTGAERDLLVANDVPLAQGYNHKLAMEELYFYRALTAARERLYLCSARRDGGGSLLERSPKVEAFLRTHAVTEADTAKDEGRYVVNARTATSEFAAANTSDPRRAASIAALGVADVDAVANAASEPNFMLHDHETLRQLLGKTRQLSATRIEDFSKCRFRFFLEQTLRIRPLRKAEISPLEAGNFVHGVLESALKQLGGDITHVEKDTLASAVNSAATAYILDTLGAGAASPRIQHLTKRLQAQSLRLLLHLKAEQEQSCFRPVDYELTIGDGAVAPLILETQEGVRVEVVGKVDRVDTMEKDGTKYLRVVDYKTGERNFNLRDVYYGLSVQMLFYLFALVENGRERYGQVQPAGVLYVPADPRLVTDSKGNLEDAARQTLCMDGLVLNDPTVLEAMERNVAGVFIPVKRKENGSFTSTHHIASMEKLGKIRRHLDALVVDMAYALYAGDIAAEPTVTSEKDPCKYCGFTATCRRDRSRRKRDLAGLGKDEYFSDEEVTVDGDGMDR